MANELREFLSTLKEKLNIIDVAGSYLTWTGAAQHIGLVARSTTKKPLRLRSMKATNITTVLGAANRATL